MTKSKKTTEQKKEKTVDAITALGIILCLLDTGRLPLNSEAKNLPGENKKAAFQILCTERMKHIREAIYSTKILSASEKQAFIGELMKQLA